MSTSETDSIELGLPILPPEPRPSLKPEPFCALNNPILKRVRSGKTRLFAADTQESRRLKLIGGRSYLGRVHICVSPRDRLSDSPLLSLDPPTQPQP